MLAARLSRGRHSAKGMFDAWSETQEQRNAILNRLRLINNRLSDVLGTTVIVFSEFGKPNGNDTMTAGELFRQTGQTSPSMGRLFAHIQSPSMLCGNPSQMASAQSQVNPRRRNSGCYKKGMTPWNKGVKGTGRKHAAAKDTQGFVCRPVVAVGHDGGIARRFASVTEAQQHFRCNDRHSITLSCQRGSLCRGVRLMYEDDYMLGGDYSYPVHRERDDWGRWLKGHKNIGHRKPDDETIERLRQIRSETSKGMCANPNNGWGKGRNKPVICLNDGEHFASIKEAAARYSLNPSHISWAMSRQRKVHGLEFIVDETINKRKKL